MMSLRHKLEYHYKAFDKSKIAPDPLQFLHLFSDEKDIEVMGLIASIFAYGNVTQITKTLTILLNMMQYRPYEFICTYKNSKSKRLLNEIYHRFYSPNDIHLLFLYLNNVYSNYGLMKQLFLESYSSEAKNLKDAITLLSIHANKFLDSRTNNAKRTTGLKFMFPDPQKGSACKRMNLFLRWMVRKDQLDFGIWNEIKPSQLIIPVDVHVANICKQLGLTRRKNVSWRMAEEITDNLKKFDPEDPVKYDFAICHIGMRKLKF
jgi:uncharacterized protein (TIGR02757 family)